MKIKIWLKRYLPAEIFATTCALLGGGITNLLFHNPILTALGSTWGENLGYYGTIIFSFIIRPFAMYIFPKITHNLYLGLIIGKLTADITFYIPTIIAFELKNKFLVK